jgi:hypothetical protein
MGIAGAILLLGCVVMVLFGPDDGNAAPALYAGGLGLLLLASALIEAAI